MHVDFDKHIKLAGIGIVPWGRLGPELWFDGYVIASLYGWDVPATAGPQVLALSDNGQPVPTLPYLNTPRLLEAPEFQQLLNQQLPGFDLLVYKPTVLPPSLQNRKLLATAPIFTETLENKAYFREHFNDIVPFPPFVIHNRHELQATEAGLRQLLQGQLRVVIQDEQLSGGKGSFVLSDLASYHRALDALNSLSKHDKVVVSEMIAPAQEVSIQCCITRHGNFVGPLQRQLIDSPLLAGNAHGGDRFCGVQITAADGQLPVYQDMRRHAERLAERLRAEGYRGIFGVDFLLADSGELYVLEVNARITGATPLLTALCEQDGGSEIGIPFYLLHLLELGGYDYQISGQPTDFAKQGSLLMVHAQEPHAVYITDMPASGTYNLNNGQLERVSDNVYLRNLHADQFIIKEYMPPGMKIKPGGRLAILHFACPAFTVGGQLLECAEQAVMALRQSIQLTIASD